MREKKEVEAGPRMGEPVREAKVKSAARNQRRVEAEEVWGSKLAAMRAHAPAAAMRRARMVMRRKWSQRVAMRAVMEVARRSQIRGPVAGQESVRNCSWARGASSWEMAGAMARRDMRAKMEREK